MSDVDAVLGEYAKRPEETLGDDPSDREIENWAQTAADLRMAMHPFLEGGRYEHLNQPTEIGLSGSDAKRIVLLDIQQSESSGNMPLTMKLLFDAIYERAKQPGEMMAVFDEAHHFLQNPGGLDWLERGTRYSRHFDLSLTLISQTADEFFVHPKAKTIADNCSIKWLFRTTGLTDEHAEQLGITGRQANFVRDATPGDRTRGYSHSLLSVDDMGTAPVRVEAISQRELNVVDPSGIGTGSSNGGDR
jgi:type IV secretory pathway VirB4 component